MEKIYNKKSLYNIIRENDVIAYSVSYGGILVILVIGISFMKDIGLW